MMMKMMMMTKTPTLHLSFMLVLAFTQLMRSQPHDQKVIPCGQAQTCSIGFNVCINVSLVDEPECMECQRWEARTSPICGTPNAHPHCNLYCEGLARKDEKKKCTAEIEQYDRTAKESEQTALKHYTETILQLNETLEELELQKEQNRRLNETLKECQSYVDPECNVFSHTWIVVACVIAVGVIVTLVIVVILLFRCNQQYKKKLGIESTFSSEMEPLSVDSDATDHSSESEDKCSQTDIMEAGNTPIAPPLNASYTETDETVPKDSKKSVYENKLESENTPVRGNTHKGCTFVAGDTPSRGNTTTDENSPKPGSRLVGENTPGTGNIPSSPHEPICSANKLLQCPPSQIEDKVQVCSSFSSHNNC